MKTLELRNLGEAILYRKTGVSNHFGTSLWIQNHLILCKDFIRGSFVVFWDAPPSGKAILGELASLAPTAEAAKVRTDLREGEPRLLQTLSPSGMQDAVTARSYHTSIQMKLPDDPLKHFQSKISAIVEK